MRTFAPRQAVQVDASTSTTVRAAPVATARRRASGHGRDFTDIPVRASPEGAMHAENSRDEREADSLAEKAMGMPEPSAETHERATAQTTQPLVARDACGLGAGQPLAAGTREFMESRLGHDFSTVRIHNHAAAAASAHAMGALAYTHGRDVVFAANQFAPHTLQGRQLLAHELVHVMQQARAPGADRVQRKPDPSAYTQPARITERDADTDRIDDAYGGGSLDQQRWRDLLASADEAYKAGRTAEAQRDYLRLYADLARLAQTDRVLGSASDIRIVTGNKTNCRDAHPGLNFSMLDQAGWGANATTAFVDETGRFGVPLADRGQLQPQVAIVLTRSVFKSDKEQSLGLLRHEMMHATDDASDASKQWHASRMDKKGPELSTPAGSELLGYVEGFMTMFQLARPAPSTGNHPAFVELMGALDTGDEHPWAGASPALRSQALGQLREFYCHALDARHREAFAGWVQMKSAEVTADKLVTGDPAPEVFMPGGFDDNAQRVVGERKGPDPVPARIRQGLLQDDFFHGLRAIVAGDCQSLGKPPAKL